MTLYPCLTHLCLIRFYADWVDLTGTMIRSDNCGPAANLWSLTVPGAWTSKATSVKVIIKKKNLKDWCMNCYHSWDWILVALSELSGRSLAFFMGVDIRSSAPMKEVCNGQKLGRATDIQSQLWLKFMYNMTWLRPKQQVLEGLI